MPQQKINIKDATGTTVGVGVALDSSGNVRQLAGGAGRTVRTQVAAQTGGVNLSPDNPDKVGVSITNTSTSPLYLNMATVPPTADNYSVRVGAGDYWEAPYQYSGEIRAIWGGTGGFANITEYFSREES